MAHDFNFDGGEHLARIGATWFVSYSYYTFIDKGHMSWKNILTYKYRIDIYKRTTEYHKFWLEQIINMNDERLNTNKIELNANETKDMVRELLSFLIKK